MRYQSVAQSLISALGLECPPVALSFAEQAPSEVGGPSKEVPSACAFWRAAEQEVFFAPASAHFHCPVGALVMGFELPEAVASELQGLVGSMCNANYISADEPAHIPTNQSKPKGILYGPLAEFPATPDAVLCWLSAFQAMLWNEASGQVKWTTERTSRILGRPACAAIPGSIHQQQPAISSGCIGMRTYTQVADDRLLGVLPGAFLEPFAAALEATRSANQKMEAFYRNRLADLR